MYDSWFNWKDLLWVTAMAVTAGIGYAAGQDSYYYVTGLVELCRG